MNRLSNSPTNKPPKIGNQLIVTEDYFSTANWSKRTAENGHTIDKYFTRKLIKWTTFLSSSTFSATKQEKKHTHTHAHAHDI